MQKRKALDSECQLEQKKHMTEKEKHIVNVVYAMQADMGSDIEADMKTETCVITSNTNMDDMHKDLCTSIQPTDIAVTVKKEGISSACAHPVKKHVATITDSCSTKMKTTSSQQTEYADCNGETKSINISLDEDRSNSTLQDVQGHFPASVLALPSSQEGDMLSKSNSEETFIDIPQPLVNKDGCDVVLVPKDSSDVMLQVMKGSIAGNCEKGSAEEVHKSRAKEVKHSIREQDGSKDALELLNEDLADESGMMPEASGTCAEGNLKTLSSPIRGLIHDFASMAEPNEKNLLNSSKKDEVSFSFQTSKKFLSDESSDNHSEKACTSVESNDILPIISKDGDLSSTVSHSVSGITNCVENEVNSVSMSRTAENSFTSDPINSQDKKSDDVILEPARNLASHTRKKLLVLDLNGLLADIILDKRNVYNATKKVGGKSVFKRPFCDDFLKFCFETFDIGVWSSRRKYNVDSILDCIMGDMRHKLLFCWDQSHCTYTGFGTQENMYKPLVLKELKKLWLKEECDLPWEKGDYSASNTLLVDDSPYKAICNPPNTGIFPHPYRFDDVNDASLGPGGDLRFYLEGLAVADDVQLYVQEHPFGQQPITKNDSSWDFYLKIIEKIEQSVPTTQ